MEKSRGNGFFIYTATTQNDENCGYCLLIFYVKNPKEFVYRLVNVTFPNP